MPPRSRSREFQNPTPESESWICGQTPDFETRDSNSDSGGRAQFLCDYHISYSAELEVPNYVFHTLPKQNKLNEQYYKFIQFMTKKTFTFYHQKHKK